MHDINNKSVVVAGNGPSFKQIDYRRLPKEFDVFRVNRFYQEDKYYLGKTVTAHVVWPIEIFYFDDYVIKERNEYDIKNIYSHDHSNNGNFPVLDLLMTINTVQDIFQFNFFYEFYYKQWASSGIKAIFLAVALGYKKIYVTGIDFFDRTKDGELYAFEEAKNQLSLPSAMYNVSFNILDTSIKQVHTVLVEKEALKLVASMSDIEIYSLSEYALINEFIPLAPYQNENHYTPIDKPKDYIRDHVMNPWLENILKEEKRKTLLIEEGEEKRLLKAKQKRYKFFWVHSDSKYLIIVLFGIRITFKKKTSI